MDVAITSWLNALSAVVIRVAVIGFVVVNAAALATVAITRKQALVDRWTSPWLATNVVLVAAGIGAPLVAGVGKLLVSALATPLRALAGLLQ